MGSLNLDDLQTRNEERLHQLKSSTGLVFVEIFAVMLTEVLEFCEKGKRVKALPLIN